jgi:hypothetical protein
MFGHTKGLIRRWKRERQNNDQKKKNNMITNDHQMKEAFRILLVQKC